jgi:hypothetical protein
MKKFAIRLVGAAVLASSLVGAIAPAEARHRRHWHRDRVDAGDVIAGIFLIGAIAAIADSAGKAKQRERRDPDYRSDPPQGDHGYRAAPEGERQGQWIPGSNGDEARAVDACSWAVEGELGDNARVGQIDAVNRDGANWRVTGSVAAPESMPRDFACTYRAGRVTDVALK